MCGRYVSPDEADIEREWHVGRHNLAQRIAEVFNVAPTMVVPIVTHAGLMLAQWGFVPTWWKQEKPPTSTINARIEEAAEKPMWRNAIRRSRCLVPARGYYEWLVGPDGKIPHFIRAADQQPIAMAGLYSVRPMDAQPASFAVCTRESAGPIAELHHRMPLVLPRSLWEAWLDPRQQDAAAIIQQAMAASITAFDAYRVSKYVNAPGNQGAKCIEPMVA